MTYFIIRLKVGKYDSNKLELKFPLSFLQKYKTVSYISKIFSMKFPINPWLNKSFFP